MALDLSPTALVNAGGGALFMLVGILVLLWGRKERRAWWVGGTAITFGLLYLTQNLSPQQGLSSANNWGFATLATLVVVLAAGLTAHLARDASKSDRGFLAAMAVAIGAASVLMGVLRFLLRAGSSAPDTALSYGVYSAVWLAHPLSLALTCAAAFSAARKSPRDARARRGLVLLGLAFGLWAIFERLSSSALFPGAGEGLRWAGALAYFLGTTLCPIILLVSTTTPQEPKLGRLAFFALLTVGLLALPVAMADRAVEVATGDDPNAWGAFGLLRTIGAALLIMAVVRYDLLGVPLPRLAASRGVLAAGALATLFIVAQIAQNFLSAQYGLLAGGVIAGVLLVAARPIERALERREPARAGASADHEWAYRLALRGALADGAMTRAEEAHLAELAEHLAIPARTALRLRHEVEDELRSVDG